MNETGPEQTAVRQAQLIVGVILASALAIAAVAVSIGPQAHVPAAVLPVALAGLVSPVIGFRLPLWLRDRMEPATPIDRRCGAYVRATLLGVAVGEVAAILGVAGYTLSGEPIALVGVATLVLLTGAIWPSEERIRAFVEPDPTR